MSVLKKTAAKPISLNEEQQAVVSAREGYWKTLAGPGSGKSACLVARFASLIEEGVSPDEILSLSFTKAAAQNLRDRVESQVGKLSISRTGSGASTFHAWALNFAIGERDEYSFELAEFPLAAEPAATKIAGESARRYEVNPRDLRSVVSLLRRKRICPNTEIRDAERALDPKRLKLALAYKDYNKRCEDAGVLDFDGLIYHAVDILSKKPDVRKRWVRDCLQIDEAQDCSQIEWDLAKLLSGPSVLAVGDISQGIYGFRASDSRLFANMDKIFPGTKTLYLSANFRSSPEIVDFIRPLAVSQDLATKFHTKNQSGPKPEVRGFASAALEADWIASQLKPQPKEDECSLFQ